MTINKLDGTFKLKYMVFSLHVNGLNALIQSKHCETRGKQDKTKTTTWFTRDRCSVSECRTFGILRTAKYHMQTSKYSGSSLTTLEQI